MNDRPFKIEVGDVRLRNGSLATVVLTDANKASVNPIQGYWIDFDKELFPISWNSNGTHDATVNQDIIGKWEE